MTLKFEKEIKDVRGNILFCKHENVSINIVEIKKGYARGGHYHKYDQMHFIISGKIEYFEKNIKTTKETRKIIEGSNPILIPANTAHMFIALEETLFLEYFSKEYHAVNYPKYRNIVKKLIRKN
jgi:quercetin dioxygenase-like cupin family protein